MCFSQKKKSHLKHLFNPVHPHLDKEDGGMGLKSLRSVCDLTRIKHDIQLRNDWLNGMPTKHSEVISMAWERFVKNPEKESNKRSVTVCAAIQNAMGAYNINIEQTPEEHMLHRVIQEDLELAYKHSMVRGKKKYTDGSISDKRPR